LFRSMDGTHLRNVLSYNLSGDLGLYNIRTIHVEVVLNGKYVGLYQLAESINIESDRIDITDWEKLAEKVSGAIVKKEGLNKEQGEQLSASMKKDLSWITDGSYDKYKISDYYDMSDYDTTGGYLIELDEYYDEESEFVTEHDVPIMLKSPEYLRTNKEMFGYINNYFKEMEDALFSEDGYNDNNKHYSEYLDMDSFIDYWIVNQAFKSVELLFKSAFMYKASGEPLIFGPLWDMDWSSGNHVNLVESSATYNEWNHSESQDREYWYRTIYDDPYFIVALQDRWYEVRDKIKEYIDSIDVWQDKLSTAVEANNKVWGDLGGWGYDKECSEFKRWMNNRLKWMDKQLSLRDPDIMEMGIRQSDDIKLSFTDSDGRNLNAGSTDGILKTDVVCDGNGKIIVNAAVSDNDIKAVDIYINGLKSGTESVSGNKASFGINPAELHSPDSGRRNVILIIGRDAGNSVKGKDYSILGVSGNHMKEAEFSVGTGILILAAAVIVIAGGFGLYIISRKKAKRV
ncbi:MAG: hypothetical protein K0S55_957, partial [Clostridia bacterium]|nr:hypothetical protein [Clostridia bacterium]